MTVPFVSVLATNDRNINGLLSGVKWASSSVSFSFTSSMTDYEFFYPDRTSHNASFLTLNVTQRAAARQWLRGDFYNVSLLSPFELTGADDRNATIRIAMSNDPTTAYAYYPDSTVQAGDAWFNRVDYNSPKIGNYAYHTFGHEFGHSMGLKHGHETDGPANVSMNPNRDSMEFSIMTYRSYVGAPTTGGYTNETWGYAQSLMMYDIAALQHMYGAWFGHNAGNTNYTFSTTTGEMFINGVGQGTPGANRVFRTVWDGNGIDTYNLSNYTTNLTLDLSPGSWSDFSRGGTFQKAQLGDSIYARGHLFNALLYQNDLRSLIDNAIGGSGNDYIYGNQINNVLGGGSGNDYIYGYGGNDTLYGEAGADYLYGQDGNDTLVGSAGNDLLSGGNGNDILVGGISSDTLYGGFGSDTFVFNNRFEGTDLIKDFQWSPSLGGVDKIHVNSTGFGATSLSQIAYNATNGGLSFLGTVFAIIENKPAGFSVNLDVVLV
ncbi:hypothetical protein NIES30_11020 [Phormidium tenue NIES-30]|uniref:Peptidase M10 serralysin C-terminal domain-containing protein n=1 Tax=Phormidium tenue NIES-30 TaxID=549789 RepID=A0A1U7J5U1_9CYAN|nr:hypothetical protein NIES30_11020 [Phormidium tenue NIES-30]